MATRVSTLTAATPNGTDIFAVEDSNDAKKITLDAIRREVSPTGTADDVVIQAAIDALPATGGIVYLAPGVYAIAAMIQLDDNVSLIGSGRDATILRANSTVTGLSVGTDAVTYIGIVAMLGKSNCLVSDLTVDVITNTPASVPNGIIMLPGTSGAVPGYEDPIVCENCTVERCKVMGRDLGSSPSGYLIWTRRSKGVRILNNHCIGKPAGANDGSSGQEGIEIFGGYDTLVHGNYVENIGNAGIFATMTNDYPDLELVRTTITDNHIINCQYGIQALTTVLDTTDNNTVYIIDGLLIESNQVVDCYSVGISIQQTLTTLTVTGAVTVVAGETLTQATSGATGVVVDDGDLTDQYIQLSSTTGEFDTTNTLSGSTSGALGANSVPTVIPVAARNLVIKNNYVYVDNALSGQTLNYCMELDKKESLGKLEGAQIVGNTFIGGKGGSSKGLVFITRATGALIKDNLIAGDSQNSTESYYLMIVSLANEVQILANTFQDSARGTLNLSDCNKAKISDNSFFRTDLLAAGLHTIYLNNTCEYVLVQNNMSAHRVGNVFVRANSNVTYLKALDNTYLGNYSGAQIDSMDSATCNFGTTSMVDTDPNVTITNTLINPYGGCTVDVWQTGTTNISAFTVVLTNDSATITRASSSGAVTYSYLIR